MPSVIYAILFAWTAFLFNGCAESSAPLPDTETRINSMANEKDDWEVLWHARKEALEQVLGPTDGSVYHAAYPFYLGGEADVLVFKDHVRGLAYVTASLIGDDSALPNERGEYELMICLRREADWAPNLVSRLAMYTRDAILESGDTMDIASALPQPTQLTAFLYVHYSSISVAGSNAGILLCIGITADELAHAKQHGSDALVKILKTAGVFPFTELSRASVL